MADTKATETETVSPVETPEVPKGKQLGAVFNEAEQRELDKLRGALNLSKNSEVIKRAVADLVKNEAPRVKAYEDYQAQFGA